MTDFYKNTIYLSFEHQKLLTKRCRLSGAKTKHNLNELLANIHMKDKPANVKIVVTESVYLIRNLRIALKRSTLKII